MYEDDKAGLVYNAILHTTDEQLRCETACNKYKY